MPHSLLAVHLQCVLTRSANIRITIPARKLTILDSESKKIQPVDANQRIVIRGIQGQVVVLGIALQPILPFQVTADSVHQGMRQLRQFSAGGFIVPMKTGARTIGACDVHTIQKQHVKMNGRYARVSSPSSLQFGAGARAEDRDGQPVARDGPGEASGDDVNDQAEGPDIDALQGDRPIVYLDTGERC